jgi:hypothetical protein
VTSNEHRLEQSVPNSDETGTRFQRLFRNPDVLVTVAAVLLLSSLTALGVHGSSLAALSPDGAPDQDSLLVGSPRAIRSDEFLVWSPIKLGQVYAGFPQKRLFGMGIVDAGASWRHHLPNRSVGHAIYSPFNIPLLLLPPGPGFAAYWWLPFFAAFIGVYFWLRRLGARWAAALPCALLVVLAPAAVWWSGWYLYGIAHSAGTCALLMVSVDFWSKRRRIAVASLVAAVLVAVGLPWTYQPWAVPPALFTGAVTLAWGVSDRDRRRSFVAVIGVFLAAFVAASLWYLIHERQYYQALGGTAYPGSRRDVGGGVGIGTLFSSLFAASVTGEAGARIQGTNLSELAMGWTMALPLSIAIAVLARPALQRDEDRNVLVATLLTATILSSWTVIQWPGLLAKVTLLEFVPPKRLASHIGFYGIVALALLVGDASRWQRIKAWLGPRAIALLGLFVLGITAWAATEFRSIHLPDLTSRTLVAVYLFVVLVTVLLASGRAVLALSMFAAAAFIVAAFVNPVMRGIGAIRESPAAHELRRINTEIVAPHDGTWAADDIMLVPLVNGNGFDALSSFNDPVNREGWRLLDPMGQYEEEWNRFAYILFAWEPGRGDLTIEAVQADVVRVHADPCAPVFDDFELRAVIASTPISGQCLEFASNIEWQGVTRTVWLREITP